MSLLVFEILQLAFSPSHPLPSLPPTPSAKAGRFAAVTVYITSTFPHDCANLLTSTIRSHKTRGQVELLTPLTG